MPKFNLSVFRVLTAAIALFATANSSMAQLSSNCQGGNDYSGFSITIDTVATNIGPIPDLTGAETDLTGYNTYHLYLQCEAENDLLGAVGGDINAPVSITTTTDFYQAELGATSEPNAGLFFAYPQVQFDSYVTIGLVTAADNNLGESPTQIVEDNGVMPISIGFENGGDLIIDSPTGSTWYIADAEAASNCAAGSDLKILFAQVTTDGDIDGDIQFQVYRNGLQSAENCIRPYLSIPNPFLGGGCMDPTACNFDPEAEFENGSCDFCSCPDTSILYSVSFPSDSVPNYFLDIELIANHDTTNLPELAGMKTYRMYIATAEPQDTLTAVYGNDQTPLEISSSAPFYQDVLGAVTPSTIQEFYYSIQPSVVYDSWVTIGIDRRPEDYGVGYSSVFTASDPNLGSSWMANFDPGSGAAGGNILANTNVGGIWSTTNPTVQNGIPDSDQRVLIGQFTSSGVISGTIAAQILPQTLPEGDDEYRLTFLFSTAELGLTAVSPEFCFCDSLPDIDNDGICDEVDPCVGYYDFCGVCNGPGPVYDCGCSDLPTGACNCNGDTLDVTGICGGGCTSDLDGDGVCDTDELWGCTDSLSCSFEFFATEEDGSCLYSDAIGVCGGDCVSDHDANGICDTQDALHCGDGTIWDNDLAQCVISCTSDLNRDGAVAIGDLLILLSDFANFCEDLD